MPTRGSPGGLTPSSPHFSTPDGIVIPAARGYAGNMNTLALPLSAHLGLVIAPKAAAPLMLDLAARLALNAPLRVLDGGNQFNAYPVARTIRRYTANLTAVLEAIQLSRAFTCYQMAALLADTLPQPTPTLVLDLLSTFYDENVRLPESQRLLEVCLLRLQQLSRQAPLIISVRPPTACPERTCLLESLQGAVDQVWEIPAPPEPALPAQLMLPDFA